MKKYIELEEITVVGIDLAKSVFHLQGVNDQGEMVEIGGIGDSVFFY